MATFQNRTVSSTYKGLLNIDNSNAGIDGTIRYVQDGEGTASVLGLSSNGVTVNGTFKIGTSTLALSGAYVLTITLSNTTNVTLPTSGTLATLTGTETFTNKTLTAPIIATISNTGILTLPTSTDTLVGRATTDTLTNKTLTNPIIAQINDSNSNETLKLAIGSALAVNEITITNSATTVAPTITSTGGDTNIGITISGKGTGAVTLGQATSTGVIHAADQPILDSSSNELIKFTKAASAVNEITVTNAATGGFPIISSTGGDTNISLVFQTKGTGIYGFFGTSTTSAKLHLYEDTDNGTNSIIFSTPAALAADRTYSLPDTDISTFVVQRVSTQTGAVATGTTTIPADDTIPQNTEGDQYMSLAVTPKNTANILKIEVILHGANSVASAYTAITALFQDATANALASTISTVANQNHMYEHKFVHVMSAGTTSSTTFKVRSGSSSAGTTTFNGQSSARLLGGVIASSIIITEYSS